MEVRIYALPSDELVKTLARESGDSWKLAFSPDGKVLFSLSTVALGREGVERH